MFFPLTEDSVEITPKYSPIFMVTSSPLFTSNGVTMTPPQKVDFIIVLVQLPDKIKHIDNTRIPIDFFIL